VGADEVPQAALLAAVLPLAVTPEDDRERLARIYAAEIRRLVAVGRVLTGDAAAGEDLAHEVFLQAARRSRSEPGYLREPAWPWLRAAMVRAAGQRRRGLLREMRRLVRSYQRPAEMRLPDSVIDCVAALGTLPPRMRTCVVLFYGEDLSVAEVAEALGCSPRTVENHLRTARARLAVLLGDGTHGDGR
jgi:RNA polymerase sigma factor (sigma-70 family)